MNKLKKSPLKDKPLRNPGQSLDEEIHKIVYEETAPYILIPVILFVMALLEWYRFFYYTPLQPIIWTIILILVTIYSINKYQKQKRRVQKLLLGRDGERVVGQYLELLREKGYRVFHDLIGQDFNLDHVVVSEHGVFVVETKTFSKPKRGEAVITCNGGDLLVNGYKTEKNYIVQAKAEANWLEGVIKDSTGRTIPVKPVIVFPGWYIKNDNRNSTNVWVLNPKALPKYIENAPKILNKEDMMLISYHISRYIRAL